MLEFIELFLVKVCNFVGETVKDLYNNVIEYYQRNIDDLKDILIRAKAGKHRKSIDGDGFAKRRYT